MITEVGGGVSVIYVDMIRNYVYASKLGNYAEYGNAPNKDEVLQYVELSFVIDVIAILPFNNFLRFHI